MKKTLSRPFPTDATAWNRFVAGSVPWLIALLASLSVVMVGLFLFTSIRRLHYAFEYDWIEDGVLASIQHIRSGLPLYQSPTTLFTPYLYTPVYLYAASALSHLSGASFFTLRLLSLIASLGCFTMLYLLVYSEIRKHLPALAAVGFFAACYPVVQASFDLGRVDMLYLFFVLFAFFATRHLNPVFAALLWVLAFQTKQGVLPVALLALFYNWGCPRRLLLGLASFAALLIASIYWLNHITQGWYSYYVFGMTGGFGFDVHQTIRFVPVDILGACGCAITMIVAALLLQPPNLRGTAFSFYTLGSVGMILFTGYIRAHRGANVNSLLPMYLWLAILFALSLARLIAWHQDNPSAMTAAVLSTFLIAAAFQLIQHLYSPNEYIPQPKQLQERAAFEHQLQSIPGDVLVISHPEYGSLAGKPLFAGSESIGAVVEASRRDVGDELLQQYRTLLDSGTIHAVVLDIPAEEFLKRKRSWMPTNFLRLYPLRVDAVGAGNVRFTSEPRYIYLECGLRSTAVALDPRIDTSACSFSKS